MKSLCAKVKRALPCSQTSMCKMLRSVASKSRCQSQTPTKSKHFEPVAIPSAILFERDPIPIFGKFNSSAASLVRSNSKLSTNGAGIARTIKRTSARLDSLKPANFPITSPSAPEDDWNWNTELSPRDGSVPTGTRFRRCCVMREIETLRHSSYAPYRPPNLWRFSSNVILWRMRSSCASPAAR